METLNLPAYPFKIITRNKRTQIFDGVRRKYVALTPEEWVRQHVVEFLVSEKQVPRSLIAIEMKLKVNQLAKRADIVVFNRQGEPTLVVECKAPHIKITQDTFDQVARYNMDLQVPWVVATNGINHYFCWIDLQKRTYAFVRELPNYEDW